MVKMVSIDIGCGKRKYSNSIGLDKIKIGDVDIICDVDNYGLPFKKNTIDFVYTRHFLEHVQNFEFVVKEIHRVVKPDGKIDVIVPHFSNSLAYSDFTHKRYFGYYTFDYFSPMNYQGGRKVPEYYTDFKFKIIRKKLMFTHYPIIKNVFNKIFNSSEIFSKIYESYLTFMFPCYEIEYILKPIKK
ncbi:MAG: class I SAM-dependent methyltransferase [Candidatus Aenigmatarchaeota archaeon]|nr:MAG: class I SAM-dependent methyltransferase [Candidatus Aenigmarchaeota archaeon]